MNTMLPSDLRDYQAPTFWRLHRDKFWGGVFFLLLGIAIMQPNAARDAESPSGIAKPTAAHVAALDCQRLQDRLWLRGAIMHHGDLMTESQCWYGSVERRSVQ